MIKTSSHTLSFANTQKKNGLASLIAEYRRCLQHFVDYLWENGYEFTNGKGEKARFCVKENLYNAPRLISSEIIEQSGLTSPLTGRALKCCMTQAASMINAATRKQAKRLFVLEERKRSGSSKKERRLLARKVKQNIPKKPNVAQAKVELNSLCCDLKECVGEFDAFLRLKSVFKDKTEILLPIKYHRHSLKLRSKGVRKNSFLLSNNSVDFRWELPEKPEKVDGVTLGADQGMKDVLTLSDGNKTPNTDTHGHSLSSIIEKVSRKKRGSKAFQRAKRHQENFVNWSINQLNFSNVKQLNLEKIWNIGFRRRTSRKLSHWQNTLIVDKIKQKCDDEGVRLTLQSCTYRSQRCSACGNVRKSNRKGKIYECKRCGSALDADLNAAKNHEMSLPEIPWQVRKLGLNKKDGFLWTPDGLFDLGGGSLQSPLEKEK